MAIPKLEKGKKEVIPVPLKKKDEQHMGVKKGKKK